MRLEKNLGLKTYDEYVAHCKKQNGETLGELRRQGRLVVIEYTRTPVDTYRPERLDAGLVKGGSLQVRGEPNGVLVAYEQENGAITFGWSSRHPTKERRSFNKSVAVHKALLRAKASEIEGGIARPDSMPTHIWYFSHEFVNTVSAQMDDLKRKRNAALIASD